MGLLERYFALGLTILKRLVHECMFMFNVLTPENAIAKRKCEFLSSVVASDNNITYFVLGLCC